ncbi:hypothetical protein F5B20DRAFT_566323 [Whalleya microplaca]|nr:hypothetical protein F5B20DRAFT_566323 [Whalleya microplaca]
MVFVPDQVAEDAELRETLKAGFLSIMIEAGVLVDAEVPFDRKLVVSSSFALKAAEGNGIKIVDGSIRLILNVLTTPSRVISGSAAMLSELVAKAEDTLVRILAQVNRGEASLEEATFPNAQTFVRLAMSDGERSGEDYLGYKDRATVALRLSDIFLDARKKSLEQQERITKLLCLLIVATP